MSYPGLFRARILSILRPGMPPSEARALEHLGRYIADAVMDYAGTSGYERPHRSEAEGYRYILEVVAEEIKGLADFLVPMSSNLTLTIEEETPEWWQIGYYTDFSFRLRRHLSTLALRIESALDPSPEEVKEWRAALPREIPEWNRSLSSLTLPTAARRSTPTRAGFVASEAEADLALVKDAFDFLRQRIRALRNELRPHQADPKLPTEETKRVTELFRGLEGLVSLAELCYGHAEIILNGDPDAEPDDGP